MFFIAEKVGGAENAEEVCCNSDFRFQPVGRMDRDTRVGMSFFVRMVG